MNTRLEKVIKGLKKIIDMYDRQDLFEFSKDYIKIKPKTDKAVWLWFYLILLVFTPIGIFIYLLTQDTPDHVTLVLTIGLATYFGITLFSLLCGQQTLVVDLLHKQFVLENVHKTFTRQKEPIHIDFSKVHTVTLKQKSLSHNNRWTRINFLDVDGHNLAYIDLGADFPDNIIAEKVKFFLSVILLTYNNKKLESV